MKTRNQCYKTFWASKLKAQKCLLMCKWRQISRVMCRYGANNKLFWCAVSLGQKSNRVLVAEVTVSCSHVRRATLKMQTSWDVSSHATRTSSRRCCAQTTKWSTQESFGRTSRSGRMGWIRFTRSSGRPLAPETTPRRSENTFPDSITSLSTNCPNFGSPLHPNLLTQQIIWSMYVS